MLQNREVEKEFEKHIKENELVIWKVCSIYAFNQADKQDLFQEIIIQCWKAFPKFKWQAKFSTWLYRIAINTAITGLRNRKNFISSYEPSLLPEQVAESTNSETEEQLALMYKAIEHLNPIERAIVMLYMEDKNYEEMEDVLGISQGTLRVKMNRIKDKLRELTKNN